MATPITVVSQLDVRIGDSELDDKFESMITEVVVDQHAGLPGMFTVRLYDSDLSLLDTGPFNLAAQVEIFSKLPNNDRISLIKGEITSLEPHFGEGMIAELLVRGYDPAHRLYREKKSKTYMNVKDSDIATEFARSCRLESDVETTQIVYEHLYQHNQSDLAFLMQRAWRIGFECFIEGNKLIFRRPTVKQSDVKLAWGEDLLSFSPRMTLAEQVEQVVVKGWDIQKKSVITAQATQGRLYAKIAEIEESKRDGKQWSQKISSDSKFVIVDYPVVNQTEADTLAAARLDEISGVFVEAEGTAFRRPDIRAGQTVNLEGLGKRFSGTYLVTSASHTYTNGGFRTTFTVSGTRSGLISDHLMQGSQMDRWPGVVTAIVTNTDDPNGWGAVKVKFPWMTEKEESCWARVVGIGAGPDSGFCITPAVDDEVVVTFMHGDFGNPIIIGGLWNGVDKRPKSVESAAQGEKPLVRTWYSRTGHQITTYDNADNKIHLETANGHVISMDDAKQKISVRSKGGLEIVLDDDGKEIKITSGGKITVKASSEVQVEASSNLTMKANGNIQLQATGNLQLEATGNLQMKATGRASLESAAVAALSAPQISLG